MNNATELELFQEHVFPDSETPCQGDKQSTDNKKGGHRSWYQHKSSGTPREDFLKFTRVECHGLFVEGKTVMGVTLHEVCLLHLSSYESQQEV
eukprot:4322103-Amphidinium_carterae.2